MGVFVPIWLVLPRCEPTNLCVCVFVLCHFALISPYSNGAVQIRVGLELAEPDWGGVLKKHIADLNTSALEADLPVKYMKFLNSAE